MKHFTKLKYLLSGLALSALLPACDTIDENDRYIEMDPIQPKRAVLIEEFTGQMCTNCPEGHDIVASLREQYGTSFIPVSIHASTLSIKEDMGGIQALAIPEGTTYYENAGSPNLPAAVIDRSTGAIGRDSWAATVRAELEKDADADIEIDAAVNGDKIDIALTLKSARNVDCRLQVWIVENGIVTYQYDHGRDVLDYTHNHVLRGVVNGTDGEPVAIKENVFLEKTYSTALNPKWKPANLAVVAFVFDSNGVIQAAEAPVAAAE